MSTLFIAAIAFSLSQLVLSILLLVRQPGWGLRERLFGLLLLAILGYLLTPLLSATPFGIVATTLQTAAPGMFWLFSACVFDDHFRLRTWQVLLVKFTVLMPLAGYLLALWQVHMDWLFIDLPQALEFLLLAMTLWVVVQHWRTDLVESRRRLRIWFVGLNGSYLLILIASREILFPGAAWLQTLEYLPPAVLLLAINSMLLRYDSPLLFLHTVSTPVGSDDEPAAALSREPDSTAEATAEPIDHELVAALRSHMQEQHAWREMGLTIGMLAQQLEVPQYRLRSAINTGLGYRNFSDFLNSYRVSEAATRLVSSDERQLAVLTIAMDAGFRSLSSFNKAFKDTYGQTPSAWRKDQA